MATIRCPHCGSPATLRGNRWECGWCGDFGAISSLRPSHRATASHSTPAGLRALEYGVHSILEGMQACLEERDVTNSEAFHLALYAMTHGMISAAVPNQNCFPLAQAFLRTYPVCTFSEFQKWVSSGIPAFSSDFLLSKKELGAFWQKLLPQLPHYDGYNAWPQWLYQIFDGWSQVEGIFLGVDSQDLMENMQDLLNTHWRTYGIIHPNRKALEDAVRRWDLEENEWACRDLLIASFPEAVRNFPPEALLEMDTMDLMLTVSGRSPQTALKMMKLLLNTAQSNLDNPEVAQQLLGNDFYDLCMDPQFQPILLAELKKDEILAHQLFQSAYVGAPQESILEACDFYGELSLKQRLYSLLVQNPYFEDFE